MRHISTYMDNDGNKVREFTDGNVIIRTTYKNQPSEQAIKNFNQKYNDYFSEFNKPSIFDRELA